MFVVVDIYICTLDTSNIIDHRSDGPSTLPHGLHKNRIKILVSLPFIPETVAVSELQ